MLAAVDCIGAEVCAMLLCPSGDVRIWTECPKGVEEEHFFWHLYQKRRSLTKLEKPLLTKPKKKNRKWGPHKIPPEFFFLFWPTNEKKLTLPTNEKKLTLARQLWRVYKIPPEKSKNGDLTKSLLKYVFFVLTHKWEKTNLAHKWEKNNSGHNLHPYKSPPKKLRT